MMSAEFLNPTELSKNIARLLFCSDWYLWGKISPPDVELIAQFLADYVTGEEDREFSYMAEDGENQDSVSNFISYYELNIRCIAMQSCMGKGEKLAAALIYFRYCYDHNEFMELTQLELVLSLTEEERDSGAFLKELVNTLLALEQKYNKELGIIYKMD